LVVVSSKEGRKNNKKNQSGDSSENGFCSCGLPACCCQPAVAGCVIYADLRGELSTHLAPRRLCLLRVLLWGASATSFPLSKFTGKVTLHPLSQASLFIYSSHGKWVFPSLLWSFPPTTTFTSFPIPGCWACAAAPAFSGRLVYLQFCEGFPSLPFRAQGTLPSLLHIFFVVIAYYSVSFFSLGGDWSVQGAMLIWPTVVCGSTAVPLISPCHPCPPKPSGCWSLVAAWDPSWFLHLMWSGDAMSRIEVWRSHGFASSLWFFL
jgi:hypothetical protein